MSEQRRQEFQALLEDWASAIVANDPVRIASFAEPDWVIVGPEGVPEARGSFLALVASGDLMHTDMAFEVPNVRVFADAAVVLAHGTNHGTWRGEPFAADEWVTDVFVRRNDGWRCSMSALTPNYAASLKKSNPGHADCQPTCHLRRGTLTRIRCRHRRLAESSAYTALMEFPRITVNPEVMGGIATLRGLRIPVATVVVMVADGMTTQEILTDLPDLEAADVAEALRYAAELTRERHLPLRTSA